MRSAEAICGVYTDLNRDLLLSGVLVHDCGKMWENGYPEDGFGQNVNLHGEMLGHIPLGIEVVNKLWRQLADSPAAALELCAKEPVDFVLSDQKMPGMSGLELLEEVARRWPATGRALLTGWPEEVPPERARALGLAAVLPKPWDDAELKRILHSILD